MRDITVLFIMLSFLILRSDAGSCYKYLKKSKRTCTGWWSRRCSTKYFSQRVCCDNYIGAACSIPKCRGGYGTNTCNINNEGYVKYKDGKVVKNSGGECYVPFRCRNCNEGYYPVTSKDGYCKACYRPSHCNLPVCTKSSDYRCDYCEGEYIREKPGYNVYSGRPDNKKCQRACSWKSGARCFPGTCSGNMILENDCNCARGFLSKHNDCSIATTEKTPVIKDMHVVLNGHASQRKILDKALMKTYWTNEYKWSNISIKGSSNYVLEIDRPKIPNYVTTYYVGIEQQTMSSTLIRGSDFGQWTVNGGCTNFNENCDIENSNISITSIEPWKKILKNGRFQHSDKIKFKLSAKNGGKVMYEDRSSFTRPYMTNQYFLNGITTNEEMELNFDMFPPTHCFEQDNSCPQDALNVTDFLTESYLTVYWDGWSDSDSGIDGYELSIYYLENSPYNNLLMHKRMLSAVKFPASQSSATLSLEDPGPYSIELIVYDRAQNFKVARRIMLYDNESIVGLYGEGPKIVQANENGWINEYTKYIEVEWPQRFQNVRHSKGGWLNGVQEVRDVAKDLDDREGRSRRTIDELNNIEGIVRFDISRKVEVDGIASQDPYEAVPECFFRLERMFYADEKITDGKKLTYFIRGIDAFGKYAEDNVTVMIDLSPPIVQNILLTKNDKFNINSFKRKEIIMTFEAFDYNSGMYNISWKVIDNSTKTTVSGGQTQVQSIENIETIDECRNTSGRTGGSDCYCSPYNGCFHNHFQVKIQIPNGNKNDFVSGMKPRDTKYVIEVTASNYAGLSTTRREEVKL